MSVSLQPPCEIRSAAAWEAALSPRTIVIDLALGGWRPRAAARELAAALDVTLPAIATPARAQATDAWQAGIVGLGVDDEAEGRGGALRAHEDFEAIRRETGSRALDVLLLPPLFGLPLREGDGAFLDLLTQSRDVRVTVADVRIDEPFPASPLALSPGSLSPTDAPGHATRPGELTRVHGRFVINPLHRADPRTAPKQHFGQLAARTRDPWVRAFAMLFGHNLFVVPDLLFAAAASAHAAGATDLALTLLERAEDCASPPKRALAVALQQGFRIASHRFRAAAAAVPPRAAPAPLAEYVEAMRAWGQTMTGEGATAAAQLEPLTAAILDGDRPIGVYELYLLNITALARLRQGDAAGAEDLERRIEAAHLRLGAPDARLTYVNCLNISRLCRRNGRYAEARERHRRAFETVHGVMAPWEVFHLAILEATACQDLGEDPFDHWLRASLVWLTDPVRAAVPMRAVRTLCGPATTRRDPNAIEAALLARLPPSPRAAGEVRPGRWRDGASAQDTRDLGFAVVAIADAGPTAPAPAPTPLAQRVSDILTARFPDLAGRGVLIDLTRGLGFEDGASARKALAIRAGTGAPDTRAEARLNPAVAAIIEDVDHIRAEWRRRRTSARLDPADGRLAQALWRDGRLIIESDEVPRALMLERCGILLVEWGIDACTEVGPRSPSSETFAKM